MILFLSVERVSEEPEELRLFCCTGAHPIKSRLQSLCEAQLRGDPLSGHLFVFTNGRRNRIKLLYWDGDGLWVCAKRLEEGRFTWPVSESGQVDLRGEEGWKCGQRRIGIVAECRTKDNFKNRSLQRNYFS